MKIKTKTRSDRPTIIYVDTETTGLETWQEAIPFAVGILWGTPENPTVKYYEWLVEPTTRELVRDEEFDSDIVDIKDLLEDPKITKVFHNAKFDIFNLEKIGIFVKGRIEDTSFAARVCNSLEEMFGLKPLSYRLFSYPMDDLLDLKMWVKKLRTAAKKKSWDLHPDTEADYWLCQYVDTLLPELSKRERDMIRNACGAYCSGDVFRTMLLWSKYEKDLDSDECYRNTYERELQLLRGPIMAMERRGMTISKAATTKELRITRKKADKFEAIILDMARKKGWLWFNPNSPKQLSQILYGPKRGPVMLGKKIIRPGSYGLTPGEYTKGGDGGTSWNALREIANHSFVRNLLQYRSMDKSINTFFQKYLDMMRFIDDDKPHDVMVLHPSLNQCGTVTGRFSSNNPNLQQVGKGFGFGRGFEPPQTRRPFQPRPGYIWYPADYVQMELRVFADLADVESMLEAIYAGRDLNTENANRAWGGKGNHHAVEAAAYALELGSDVVSTKKVSDAWRDIGWSKRDSRHGALSSGALEVSEEWLSGFDYDIVAAEATLGKNSSRNRSKCVTFAKIFGGGPGAVLDLLFCTLEEAKRYWKQYDQAFPEIQRYIRSMSKRAEMDGYVINLYGRKLQIDPKFSYRATNYMIQGSCADMMKTGIWGCWNYYTKSGIDGHMPLTIHDELFHEIKEGHESPKILKGLCDIMSDHGGRLRVTMPVEMKRCTERWDKKEDLLFA